MYGIYTYPFHPLDVDAKIIQPERCNASYLVGISLFTNKRLMFDEINLGF